MSSTGTLEKRRLFFLEEQRYQWDVREKIIALWKKKDKKYVPTTATKFILETLKTDMAVIVTGDSGCGKSAVVHHVALALERQGYDIYPINEPSEIMKVFCKDKLQVFVIDDICGRFAVDHSLSDSWERVEQSIELLLMTDDTTGNEDSENCNLFMEEPDHILPKREKDGNRTLEKVMIDSSMVKRKTHDKKHISYKFKIIATSRENIFKDTAFPEFSFFRFKACSFLHNFKLSKDKLKLIAKSYLNETEQNAIENIDQFAFFPLLCSWYDDIKNLRLFTHPTKVIDDEIKGIKKNSPASFIALSLLVIHNTDLRKDSINSSDCIIELIGKECDIEQALSKKPDDVTFKRLLGTFITETEEGYTAVHDKMFDIISISISAFIMKTIIKKAAMEFIRSRMQFKSLGECDIPNIIYIHKDNEELYMDRINSEIKKRNYWPVFNNLNTKKDQYRKRLTQYLDEHFKSSPEDLTINSEKITPLHVVATLGYIDLVEYFVQRHGNQLLQTDKNGQTPFLNACGNGHEQVVLFLIGFFHRYKKMLSKTTDDESALHLAAAKGHIKVVQLLIKFGINVNEQNTNESTPFYLACKAGHIEIVKYLLKLNGDKKDSRMDTRLKNMYGSSALHAACFYGHTDIVSLLINYGLDVNETAKDDSTPLHYACFTGRTNLVKFLLDLNGHIKNSCVDTTIKDKQGWTALHEACSSGHSEIVTLLVDYGMNVNETDRVNFTPFHYACRSGNINLVKLLLDLNGDIKNSCVDTTIKNTEGFNALHLACENGQTEIVKLLVHYGMDINETGYDNITPLIFACINGQYHTAKMMLDLNEGTKDSIVDTTITDFKDRATAFHVACCKGHTDIVSLLASHGVDMNVKATQNRTSFYLACGNGHYNTVKLLLELNGDIKDSRVDTTIKASLGWSCLHAACLEGHTDIVKLLAENEFCVNELTYNKSTPLHIACENGHYNAVKVLLDLNKDIKDSRVDTGIKNEDGWTALHIACFNGHTNVVTLLADNYMDVNALTDTSCTPLYLACKQGNYDTVKTLLDLNKDNKNSRVDTRIANQEGWTALHIACWNGHTDIVTLLINYGMNVNNLTKNNRTPFFLACENDRYSTVNFLLKLNWDVKDSRVDTRIKNENGLTAFDIACKMNHNRVVTLLKDHKLDSSKCCLL